MSATATFWAWKHIGEKDLSMPASLVLLALAHRHNQETGRCDPSVTKVAQDLNISERSVRYALRELEAEKLIATIERRKRTGRGKRNLTNRYILRGGAQFAGRMGHSLQTNLKDKHPDQPERSPSAYDDLANILDDVEDAINLGRACGDWRDLSENEEGEE